MESEKREVSSWLDIPLLSYLPKFNIESIIIAIILVLAVISRFSILGARVMSHDEINHVVPSWELYQGRSYAHDPVTHGPMQFHLVALSYFLFGDNDFSSRVPAALFSIATVAFTIFGMRRYLGRNGALAAGLLMLISPYMLFYGRYTRNEAFVGLFAVLMVYAVLRFLEKGDAKSLFILTITTSLHFATKETSYIYTAQLLIFLGLLFFFRILKFSWKEEKKRNLFLILMTVAFVCLFVTLSLAVYDAAMTKEAAQSADPAAVEAAPAPAPAPMSITRILMMVFIGLTAGAGGSALFVLVRSMGWQTIRQERSFDLLILVGSLILPLLTALPVSLIGWNPLDYGTTGIVRTSIILVIMAAISIGIGLWWNPKVWLTHAVIFYGIFTIFYTTFFTNGQGFFTGMVGSLGYWASQQGVERGSQPWYYFALLQIPIYEFLPALGAFLAFYFGLKKQRFSTIPGFSPASQEAAGEAETGKEETLIIPPGEQNKPVPVLAFLLSWSVLSLIAYSIAGEKMPWITVHIAVPLILSAGWGLGFLLDSTDIKKITGGKRLLGILLIPVFYASLTAFIGSLFGTQPPFQGNELEQLKATSTFIFALVFAPLSGYGVIYFLMDLAKDRAEKVDDQMGHVFRLLGLAFFALLAVITARSAYRASFINYDQATEYMVYAHAAPGPKQALAQIEEISRRTTGGLDVVVAYDNNGLYPYWWYFRNYPNHRYYADKPTRDLKDVPLIVGSSDNYSKLDSIVKDNYIAYDYIRLWWPNQDYFNLTWDRIWFAISDPGMRTAIFNIWLNRDYSLYSSLTGSESLTLETWQPSDKMRLYIRKDIIAQIWNFGASPAVQVVEEVDPYMTRLITLLPDRVIGAPGSEPGLLNQPRGIAVAPDGSIYVADSRNNRIQHFSPDGQLIYAWGTATDLNSNDPQPGTFTEPWGVAVGQDGSVYVADTWNYRVQKFTADGKFLSVWGYSGQGSDPQLLYGPRGIAIDSAGRVLVTDTGNKRVVIYSPNGEYITQFGSSGMEAGQLDEPVGIAVGPDDLVYLADTWNQRVQTFKPDATGLIFFPTNRWEVYGWFSTSLDNKPYIAVNSAGDVFITDPEGYRILQYTAEGEFIQGWGEYSPDTDGFGLPSGIAADAEGGVWVSDAANNVLLHFTLP